MDKEKIERFISQADEDIRKSFVELKGVHHRLARVITNLNYIKEEMKLVEESKDST